MDGLVLLAWVVILIALDVAALAFGADSRDPMPDDHQRRLPGGI